VDGKRPEAVPKHMSERQPGDACQVCGLCCDGTLFDTVTEEIRGRCTHFCGDHCGIYDERPEPCRVFTCRLARYYEQGRVSLTFVRERAEEMRALTEEIRSLFPAGLVDHLGKTNVIRTSARWYLSVFSQYALSHRAFTGISPQVALRLMGLSHDYFALYFEFWDREFESEQVWVTRRTVQDSIPVEGE
jgi:Fe-S-cluster containining protein